MKIALLPPALDKNWCLEITTFGENPPCHLPPEIRESLLILMGTPVVKRANPFLQCDTRDYLLVEFWTDNEVMIATAAAFLEASLKLD